MTLWLIMMNISAIAPFLPWKNPSTQGCELNVPTSVESLCFASWKHSGRIVFVEAFCWLGRLREGLTCASMILTFSTDLAASSFFFYFSSVFRKRSKEWKRQKIKKTKEKIWKNMKKTKYRYNNTRVSQSIKALNPEPTPQGTLTL